MVVNVGIVAKFAFVLLIFVWHAVHAAFVAVGM
jgi:hypothetical protein